MKIIILLFCCWLAWCDIRWLAVPLRPLLAAVISLFIIRFLNSDTRQIYFMLFETAAAVSIYSAAKHMGSGGLGNGDIIISAMIALAYGNGRWLNVSMAAAVIGLLFILLGWLAKGRSVRRPLPFVPFLCLGQVVMLVIDAAGGSLWI